jgi:CheY-like chemotaxis protein
MRSRTVLVVEDEAPIREILTCALSDRGYEVQEARDGLQAIRALDEQHADGDRPCIVLLDMMLPRVNGLEVLRAYNRPRSPSRRCGGERQ